MPPPIGTKNLGLIKAIHVGVNPPLNIKILWYNDSTNPYTTGPAKVHYYYDVTLAEWMPLSAGANINGVFTYIAFASSCEGANFSLNFNPLDHCFWAIITSNTLIPQMQLLPEAFQNRWTKFCRCGGNENSGNYTYIAFADDCEGNNFGLDMQYEVDCESCQYADTFLVDSGNSSFQATNMGNGVEINLVNASPGQQITLDVRMLGVNLLNELTNYCVSVVTLPNFSGVLDINLGTTGDSISLNGPTSLTKQTIQNQGSQLIITIPNNGQAPINSTITIQVGTSECCAEQIEGSCYMCRCYFGLITSSTPIENLTAEMFQNKWIKICCDSDGGCDCQGMIDLLQNQISNVNRLLQDQILIYDNQIRNLNSELANLQAQLETCCNEANQKIADLEGRLEAFLVSFQEGLDSISSTAVVLAENVETLMQDNTSESIMAKISSDVSDIAIQKVNEFKDGQYSSDKDQSSTNLSNAINSERTYVDEQVSALSRGVGDLDTSLVEIDRRVTMLEGV